MDGKGTALLVIDVQVAMFDETARPHESDAMLEAIAGLIARARANAVPVVYVRHIDGSYPPMRPGHPGFEVHAAVAPRDGELLLDKLACDAFHGTRLHEHLHDLGIGRVVVTGMQTELCIDTFCRSALHRDYDVVLAADGHATWPRNGVAPEVIIAHHNALLADIPHPSRAITVLPAADVTFAP